MSTEPMRDDGNAFETVYGRLREGVLRGDLAPGAPVSQAKLAREYNTSRSPLREALRMLQREGLVDAETGKRSRIAAVSAPDLEQLYAMRITLEVLAIRLTIPAAGEAELRELRGYLDQMRASESDLDIEAWEAPHRAFHLALVAGGGERIVATITELSEHAERYRRIYLRQPRVWPTAAAEHAEIVEAFAAKDVGLAASLLAEHLARTAITVGAMLAPDYEPTSVREAVRISKRQRS